MRPISRNTLFELSYHDKNANTNIGQSIIALPFLFLSKNHKTEHTTQRKPLFFYMSPSFLFITKSYVQIIIKIQKKQKKGIMRIDYPLIQTHLDYDQQHILAKTANIPKKNTVATGGYVTSSILSVRFLLMYSCLIFCNCIKKSMVVSFLST